MEKQQQENEYKQWTLKRTKSKDKDADQLGSSSDIKPEEKKTKKNSKTKGGSDSKESLDDGKEPGPVAGLSRFESEVMFTNIAPSVKSSKTTEVSKTENSDITRQQLVVDKMHVDKVQKKFFRSKDFLSAVSSVEDKTYKTGEDVTVQIAIDNRTTKAVKAAYVEVVRDEILKKKKKAEVVKHINIDGFPMNAPGKKAMGISFNMPSIDGNFNIQITLEVKSAKLQMNLPLLIEGSSSATNGSSPVTNPKK